MSTAAETLLKLGRADSGLGTRLPVGGGEQHQQLAPPPPRDGDTTLATAATAARRSAAAAATAAAAAAAEEAQRAYELCSLDRKLALASSCLHCASQLVLLLSYRSQTVLEICLRVASIIYGIGWVLLPAAAPVFYLRWRQPILLAHRIFFFTHPLRNTRGERPGAAGSGGCYIDDIASLLAPANGGFNFSAD